MTHHTPGQMRAPALALAALLAAAPALADDCKHVSIEVELVVPTAQAPFAATVIEHECIRSNTVPLLVPLEPIGSSFRWWFQYPAERGVLVIYSAGGVLNPPLRVLVILNRVEVES